MEKETKQGERQQNLELLRCVAMMMVVALHYLGKGGLLVDLEGEELGGAGVTAWLLESFCIVAVNVYMFISGYFLCLSDFKLTRLVQLVVQVWVYSVVFGLVGVAVGWLAETPFDIHYLLTLFFPISMGHYWFMTAYVFLYLLLPFVGMAVKRMTKQQLQIATGLLLLVFCVMKSVLPVRLEMDAKGYDCLWYLCVFLAAAYVRRFGVPFLEKRTRSLALYVVCSLLVFIGTMTLRWFFLKTGSLGRMLKVCLEYNHILPFLAAAGLFGVFRSMKIQGGMAKLIQKVAPYTLGVYLLHENLGLRYTWQKWLTETLAVRGTNGVQAVAGVVLSTAAAVACVFVCGVLVDMARKFLFSVLHKGLWHLSLYHRVAAGIEKVDEIFREQKPESY